MEVEMVSATTQQLKGDREWRQSPLLPGSMAVQSISPTTLPSNIQILTVASVICNDECKYPEISARLRSPGTSYENEDCFKSWIGSLVSSSSNIELKTMRTSSWAEKAGICSVKLKRHVFGRCRDIQRYIYIRLVWSASGNQIDRKYSYVSNLLFHPKQIWLTLMSWIHWLQGYLDKVRPPQLLISV